MVKKKATEPEERKCKLKSCTKMAPWYLDRCSKHHDAYVKKCRVRRRRETIAAQKERYAKNGGKVAHVDMQAMSGTVIGWANRSGWLPVLDGSIKCVDCGNEATCWEHRDYSRPLDVDPICQSCNVRRGPAKSRMKWEQKKKQEKRA